MGRAAAEQRAWGAECGGVGLLLGLTLVTIFIGLELLHVVRAGPAADSVIVGLILVGPVPLLVCAVIGVSRSSSLILRRHGLPKSAGKSLTLKVLQDPSLFDDWLAKQAQSDR